MFYQILLLLFLLTTLVSSTDCSLLAEDYLKIVSKQDEVIVKNIYDIFENIYQQDQVILDDQSKNFKLIPSFYLQGSQMIDENIDINTILDVQVQQNNGNQWMNQFYMLTTNNNNQYQLLKGVSYQEQNFGRFPNFELWTTLEDTINTIYHGFIILDTNLIIIDCTFDDGQSESNYFYLVNQTNNEIQKTKFENQYSYDKFKKRKISSGPIDLTTVYFYRATFGQVDKEVIEIFSYSKYFGHISNYASFDAKYFFQRQQEIHQLIDFKGAKESLKIAILDDEGNILMLESIQFTYWELSKIFQGQGQSLQLDYDFSRQYFALLTSEYIYTNNVTQENNGDFTTSSKIHIAKDYLQIYSETSLILLNQQLVPKFQIQGNFTLFLGDYNNNDFLYINSKIIYYFQSDSEVNSYYQLYFVNNQISQGTVYLTHNNCKVTIDYQTITQNSSELIQVSKDNIINSPIFQLNQSYFSNYNWLVDGPNQNIVFQQQNKQLNEGKLEDINFQKYQSKENQEQIFGYGIVFKKIYPISVELDDYVVLVQYEELNFILYSCKLSQLNQICSVEYKQTKSPYLFNETNVVLKYYEGWFYLSFLTTKKELTIYEFIRNYLRGYSSYRYDNEYDQIYQIYQDILLYSTQRKTFYIQTVYSSTGMLEFTPEIFINWNPIKIFTNSITNFIYAINDDQKLVILEIKKNYQRIVQVQTINQAIDTKIIPFKNRFGILYQYDNNEINMIIYNQQDETNIYKEKLITFYEYEIENLDQFYFEESNSLLYVKIKQQSDQYIILTYNVDVTSHNSFHSIIPITGYTQSILVFQNYIMFYGDQGSLVTIINKIPRIEGTIQFNNNSFTADFQFSITYNNQQFEQKLQNQQLMRFANLYTDIVFNETAFANGILIQPNQKNYSMGNNWYIGSVTEFDSSGSQAKIESSPIEEIGSTSYLSKRISFTDLNNNQFFVLGNNGTYYIINKDTRRVQYSDTFEDDFVCENILASFESQLLLRCIYQTYSHIILGVSCIEDECQIGQSWLNSTSNSVQAQIDANGIFLFYNNFIQVYQNNILDLQSAKYYGKINLIDNCINTFQVQNIKDLHYHLYCTTINKQMIIQEFDIQSNQLEVNSKFIINLPQIINQQYYILNEAIILEIKIINILLNGEIFQADYIFIVSSGPHYGITFKFVCHQSTLDLKYTCQTPTFDIAFILQSYGNLKAMNYYVPKRIQQSQFIIVPYQIDQESYYYCFYEIPKVYNTKQPILLFGAIEIALYQNDLILYFALYFKENKPYFVHNGYVDSLAICSVSTSPQLYNLQNQQETIRISAFNKFSNSNIVTVIKVQDDPDPPNPDPPNPDPPNPDPDIDPEKPSNIYLIIWISLGVIMICIVGGISYYCYKKKQKKVDSLI